MARKRREAPKADKPNMDWLVTFSDLLTLMITFFVLLISMASMDSQKLKSTFGFFDGAFDGIEGGGGMSPSIIHLKGDEKNTGDSLGKKPSILDEGSLYAKLDRLQKEAKQLAQKLRTQYDTKNSGLHAVNSEIMDKIWDKQPIKIVHKKGKLEMDISMPLLFEPGTPILREESRQFIQQIKETINYGMVLEKVNTIKAEKGIESRYYSAWDLGIWRSSALIRALKPTSNPIAGTQSIEGKIGIALYFSSKNMN